MEDVKTTVEKKPVASLNLNSLDILSGTRDPGNPRSSASEESLAFSRQVRLSVDSPFETASDSFFQNENVLMNVSTEFANHMNSFTPCRTHSRCGAKPRIGFHSAKFQSWKRLHTSRAQLKAVSNISALLAGFAMIAMVEINLQPDLPELLYVAFASCTTLLVVIHTLALMISTCILPHVDTIAGLKRIELVEESPHNILRSYIKFAWVLSTVTGIVLFMVEVVLLCWVQFYNYSIAAAYTSTGIVIPSLAIFGYIAWKFYKNLTQHIEFNTEKDLDSLECMAAQLKRKSLSNGRSGSQTEKKHSVIDMFDTQTY